MTLTRTDRCDRDCGRRATMRIRLRNGKELLFCDAHWRQHSDALLEQANVEELRQ